MSDDHIKRSDAIEAVSISCRTCLARNIEDCEKCSVPKLRELINAIPSADRPQGKWRAKSFHEYFCNNCGFSFDMMKCEFLENMKFCPNCGVRKGANDE